MERNEKPTGCMTWPEFLQFAMQITRKSQEIGDNWELCGTEKEYSQYLSKRERHVSKTTSEESFSKSFILCDLSEAEHKEDLVYDFEYHIVYNISYMVPVLCFNASKPDGSMLTLNEAWQMLKFNGVIDLDKLAVLTQMDHPILQRPYLTIHPCQTKKLLESFSKSENLLISFISALGPFIGLHCNLQYGIKTHGT